MHQKYIVKCCIEKIEHVTPPPPPPPPMVKCPSIKGISLDTCNTFIVEAVRILTTTRTRYALTRRARESMKHHVDAWYGRRARELSLVPRPKSVAMKKQVFLYLFLICLLLSLAAFLLTNRASSSENLCESVSTSNLTPSGNYS